MSLFDQISNDIKSAMLAKDKIKLETLRGVKKEFIEAKTAKDSDGDLTDEKAISIIQKMVKQRRESASIYSSKGRSELAEKELAEVTVLEAYLPKQLSQEELEAKLKAIMEEVGASAPSDMGKVMGVATKQLAGLAAGKAISDTVKKLLS